MKKLLSLAIILGLSIVKLIAQNEFIDTGFGTHNGYTLKQTGIYDLWFTNILEHNGNLYVAEYDFNGDLTISKFDSNGILDTTFGTNGSVDLLANGDNAYNSFGHSKALFTVNTTGDALFFINGSYSNDYTNEFRVLITKLNLDGTFDTTYGTNGQYISNLTFGLDTIGAALTQDNETVVIGIKAVFFGGDFSQTVFITKIDATGALDTMFGTDGTVSLTYDYENFYPVSAIVKNQDVYILFDNSFGDGYIAKYNLDVMSYDTNFGTNGILELNNFAQDESMQTFTIDANDNLYITGSVPTGNALEYELFIYKYDTVGTLDTSFGTNGIINFQLISNSNSTTNSHKIAIDNDKILLMGTSYNWDAENYEKTFFTQFELSNGALDADFGNQGILINYLFDSVNVAYDYVNFDDSIITCGSCPSGNDPQIPCLVKYLKSTNLSINEFEKEELIAYPNPVDDLLHFDSNIIIDHIDVFDYTGKLIQSQSMKTNYIDLSYLPKGFYILKAKNIKNEFNVKVVKK